MVLPTDETSTPPLERATGIVLAVLSVQVVALVLTGVALFFVYRPITTQAWSDITKLTDFRWEEVWQLIHLWSSLVVLPTAVTAGLLAALNSDNRPAWLGWVLSPAMGVAALAAFLTGFFFLRWDQLALWAVTRATDDWGLRVIFDKQVRFVLIDGVEFAPATVARWFLIHVALGVALIALLVLTCRWSETRRQS